jgi:hypothetical protein
MPLKRWTSMFYSTGYTLLKSVDAVDRAVADGVHASMQGNTVTLRWPDGRETYHHIPIGNRGLYARWVNRFNARAAAKG